MAFFSSYSQLPDNYINLVDDDYTFTISLYSKYPPPHFYATYFLVLTE